jgi:hypothetical protein
MLLGEGGPGGHTLRQIVQIRQELKFRSAKALVHRIDRRPLAPYSDTNLNAVAPRLQEPAQPLTERRPRQTCQYLAPIFDGVKLEPRSALGLQDIGRCSVVVE